MFEEIKRTVAFLYDVDPRRTPRSSPIGTGFFASFSATEVADQKLERSLTWRYLFTAKHVVNGRDPVWVSVNILEGLQEGKSRGVFESRKEQWVLSEDADVALLDWHPDPSVVEFMCVPEAALATREVIQRDEISEGSEVFFAGLFTPHVGKRRNQPIIRSGRVALFTDEEIDWVDGTWRLHLIEAESFPGSSGSPVLVRRTKLPSGETNLYLLGLMKGAYQRVQQLGGNGGKPLLAHENMGIAAVVPADDIAALLRSPAIVERRKASVEPSLASGLLPEASGSC